jgi:hypothetical protein
MLRGSGISLLGQDNPSCTDTPGSLAFQEAFMRVAAPIAWPNGKAYLFERDADASTPGSHYARHDFLTGARDIPSEDIALNWPGLRSTRPDAAVYWGVPH